jgi:hypothetical protein
MLGIGARALACEEDAGGVGPVSSEVTCSGNRTWDLAHEAESMVELMKTESTRGPPLPICRIGLDSAWRQAIADHSHKAGPRTPRNVGPRRLGA